MRIGKFQSRRRSGGAIAATLALIFCLSGCQTPGPKHLDQVQMMMAKDQVLEIVGGPQQTYRAGGRDHWLYQNVNSPLGIYDQEIQFENGFVVYKGIRIQPKMTAEQKDQINDQAAQREAIDSQKHELDRAVRLNLPASGATPPPLDEDDRRLRDSIYGTSDPSVRKKAPDFQEIN